MTDTAIVYAGDDNYAMQIGISLLSLLDNNPFLDAYVYIFSNEISDDNKNKIQGIADEFATKLTIVDVPNPNFLANAGLSVHNVVSASAYIRLFLPDLLPEHIKKVLWIDGDTLVVDSITNLLNTDLEKNSCAMVLDSSSTFKILNGYHRSEKYYNTGVILADMEKWRADVQILLREEINRRRGKSIDEDQSYINKAFRNSILTLNPRYNMQHAFYVACDNYEKFLKEQFFRKREIYDRKTLVEARKNAVIVHFTNFTHSRPWENGCDHPMRDKWAEYKNRSLWANYPLSDVKKNDTSVFFLKRRIMHAIYVVSPIRKVFVRLKYGFWT